MLEKADKKVYGFVVVFRVSNSTKSPEHLKVSPYCICELSSYNPLVIVAKPATLVKSLVLVMMLKMMEMGCLSGCSSIFHVTLQQMVYRIYQIVDFLCI